MAEQSGKSTGWKWFSGVVGTEMCPLLPVAAGLTLGILAVAAPSICQGGLWSILSVLVAATLFFLWDPPARYRLLTGICLGCCLAFLHLWAPWQSYRRKGIEAASGTMTVRIVDPFSDPGPFDPGYKRQRVIARLTHLQLTGEAADRSCHGKILLVLPEGATADYGDVVEVQGLISAYFPVFPDQRFNYRRYLRSRGVRHQVWARECRLIRSGLSGRGFLSHLYRLRNWLAEGLIQGFRRDDNARAAAAMTLGYRQALNAATQRMFTRSGAIHLFAISGLHVGIAMAVLLLLFRCLAVPFVWRYRLVPLFLGAYVIVTGCPASAVRAWVMFSVLSLSMSTLRLQSPVNALSLAAIVLLTINPFSLFNTGFQFSFTIVCSLILGWRWVSRCVNTCFEKATWQSGVSLPVFGMRFAGRKLCLLVGCGIIAWLGSAGLVAWNNCLFIPAAVWLNVCLAGLALAILSLAVGKLLLVCLGLGMLSLPVTRILEFLLSLIHALVRIAGEGPGCMAIPRPPAGLVVSYYLLFFLLLPPRLFGRFRRLLLPAFLINIFLVFGGLRMLIPGQGRLILLHGDGQNQTGGILEINHHVPVVFFSGSYSVDRAVVEWLTVNGHDRIRIGIFPGSGTYGGKVLASILSEIEMEHVCYSERLEFPPSGQQQLLTNPPSARTVLSRAGLPADGKDLPYPLTIESFSRKDLTFTLGGSYSGRLAVGIQADGYGSTILQVRVGNELFMEEKIPASLNIQKQVIVLPEDIH